MMNFLKGASLIAVIAALLLSAWDPAVAVAQLPIQVITSVIGDSDCFGYGPPAVTPDAQSPCGTLPGVPIQETADAANTDIDLACPGSPTITFTHTFTLPGESTILGALWLMNVGGVETSYFNVRLRLGGVIPIPVPDTGSLGTALVVVPLIPPATTILESGQLVVQLTRGNPGGSACDDLFVDFAALAIAVQPLRP